MKILTDQLDLRRASNYWRVLKKRLKDEGNQLVTNCNQLKLKSPKDGKRYLTDIATTEQLLRIIQSIPSRKAEPLKLWLAQVGREHIDETPDPELIAVRLVVHLRAARLYPRMDQPAPDGDFGPQGAYRRMERLRRHRTQRVRHPHRRDHPRVDRRILFEDMPPEDPDE